MDKLNLDIIDWRGFEPAPVIGVDEVGRGCLAGPVVAAAVRFRSACDESVFTDSKCLSEIRREELYDSIVGVHDVGVGFASCQEIDTFNILNASLLAMRRAVFKLGWKSGHVLVDGNQLIPRLAGFKQTSFIKGDLRIKLIGAASIVAKVTRDRWMKELSKKYPDYGFEIHKGYPTALHREAIVRVGPCKEHRRTFRGVLFTEEG